MSMHTNLCVKDYTHISVGGGGGGGRGGGGGGGAGGA
jgi:hypothetical protein